MMVDVDSTNVNYSFEVKFFCTQSWRQQWHSHIMPPLPLYTTVKLSHEEVNLDLSCADSLLCANTCILSRLLFKACLFLALSMKILRSRHFHLFARLHANLFSRVQICVHELGRINAARMQHSIAIIFLPVLLSRCLLHICTVTIQIKLD